MVGTDMIFIDSTIEELWAEDTTITKINTTVEDTHLDEESALQIQWSLRVRIIDEDGEPVEDAVVLIYDAFDNLVSVQNTDSEGWITAINVIEKEEGATTTLIYNPYSIQVIKGKAEDTQTITVDGDTENVISLQTGAIESAEAAFPWFLAFFLVIGAFVAIGIGGIAIEVMKYGLLVFFLPLYSRIKKREMLEQPIRHRIQGYIIGNPGAHYGLIKQDLGIPNGQLVYHLNQLTKAHLVYSREDGIRKRFFPVALPVPKSGKILLTKVQKEILDVVEESSGANQKEIASSMGVSRQVAGYHLTKMEEKGYVRKELEGRETRYFPLENANA
jgi:predicted transcriptional regulator